MIASFIKNMKDFNILFKLFDMSKDPKKKDYDQSSLNTMQTIFVKLQEKYDPKECPNFKEDLITLLYYSDKNRANIEDFLRSKINKNLNVKLLNEIYIKLVSEYKDISSNTKQLITNYFTQKKKMKIHNLYYI